MVKNGGGGGVGGGVEGRGGREVGRGVVREELGYGITSLQLIRALDGFADDGKRVGGGGGGWMRGEGTWFKQHVYREQQNTCTVRLHHCHRLFFI